MAPHQTLGSCKPGVVSCDARRLREQPPRGLLRITPTLLRDGGVEGKGDPVIVMHMLPGVADLSFSEPVALCPQTCWPGTVSGLGPTITRPCGLVNLGKQSTDTDMAPPPLGASKLTSGAIFCVADEAVSLSGLLLLKVLTRGAGGGAQSPVSRRSV